MKLTKSTNKNNRGWSMDVLSLTRLVKLALLIFLMGLIGTEIGIAEESKSNVQEKRPPKTEHFYESVNSIEITQQKGPKVQLKGGDLLLVTPKEDKVLEITTDTSMFARDAEMPFSINKLKELPEKLHYMSVGLFKVNERLWLTFSLGQNKAGTLWPPNVNEQEDSLSISKRYKGSGYIYIYVIDASYITDVGVGNITQDGVLRNAVILSNIIRQPIRFVSKIDWK